METERKMMGAFLFLVGCVFFLPSFVYALDTAEVLQSGLSARRRVVDFDLRRSSGRSGNAMGARCGPGGCASDGTTTHAVIAYVDREGRQRWTVSKGMMGDWFYDRDDRVRVYYRLPQRELFSGRLRLSRTAVIDSFTDRQVPFLMPAIAVFLIYLGLLLMTHDQRKRRREATSFLDS
ncbi:MAG: hypothetical protein ABIT10_12895 [Alteraurantiacibacter sp.]